MKIIKLALVFFIVFLHAGTYAADDSAWEFTAGAKGVYSSGISESNIYYGPFAGAGYIFNILKISSRGARYINYQITDGLGSYDYIDFNELGLALDINPSGWISLNLEGQYSKGEAGYKSMFYSGGIFIEINKAALSADCSGTSSEYEYETAVIEIKNIDGSFEIDYSFTGSFSVDAGLSYSTMDFAGEYDYNKFTGRLGAFKEFTDNFYFIAGLSAGSDSDDYSILGFDTGISWMAGDYIKILALYICQYYGAPDAAAESSSVTGHGGGGNSSAVTKSGSGGSNPFLTETKRGESYMSHTASLSVSCVF